jgi:hypothetical protein
MIPRADTETHRTRGEAAMAAYLVVMHSQSGLQKKYFDTIKKIREAKDLLWERYAMIYDRSLCNANKPQRFGTHTRYNEQTKTVELYPLEDETKVTEWRKELGLPSLEEYLIPFNIIFRPKKMAHPREYGALRNAGWTPIVFPDGRVLRVRACRW